MLECEITFWDAVWKISKILQDIDSVYTTKCNEKERKLLQQVLHNKEICKIIL